MPVATLDRIGTIDREIRGRIVQRQYPPGGRLPTRAAFEVEFAASSATIQRALDLLTADGFIDSRGRNGTFVAQAPPCFSRYALVFPRSPTPGTHWSNLWTALANTGADLARRRSRELVCLYGFEGAGGYERAARLASELERQLFAGLIFASPAFYLAGTPIAAIKNLPWVALASTPPDADDTFHITLDGKAFIREALKLLRAQGGRRAAILLQASQNAEYVAQLRAALADAGFEDHPEWIQAVNLDTPFWAGQLIRLLFPPAASGRGPMQPDSLFIADDNFVEHATAALAALGYGSTVPLPVVAGANFPWVTTSHVPATRLGLNVEELFARAFELIDRRRLNQPAEPPFSILPVRHG